MNAVAAQHAPAPMEAPPHARREVAEALTWRSVRGEALARAQARSAFVIKFRFLATSIAAAAVLTIPISVVVHAAGGGFVAQSELADAEARTIRNPRFTGRDEGGDPFVVTADSAVRRSRDSEVIDLEMPRFEAGDGRSVLADRGVYDAAARTLELKENVRFISPDQQVFQSQHAFIDAKADTLTGDAPISGAGPLGDVRADAYEVRGGEAGGTVILRGNVKGTISPQDDAPPATGGREDGP